MSDAVVIVSGGLDSTVLAHFIARDYTDLHLVSFNYGQRHDKELVFAKLTARDLGATHDVVDLKCLTRLLGGSALTDDIDVPDGHYAEESMKITVVPNRNMIMLSIAAGIAVADKAGFVALGVHGGDHFIYPDCRPAFISHMDDALFAATEGFSSWTDGPIYAPFLNKTKADIVQIGDTLNVDFTNTWSCYKGDHIHCGRCGTCVERKEAFRLAKVYDPTSYADPSYEFPVYRG